MTDVTVRTMFVYHPYEGCLEGWPSPAQCIAAACQKAKSLVPSNIPLLVIEPKERTPSAQLLVGHPPPLIPRICYIAHLHGPPLKHKDPRSDMSEMVLIWFTDDVPAPTLPVFDWAAHATSFCYEDM